MDIIQVYEDGHIAKVKEELEHGADPTVDDNYAIRWACLYGYSELVSLLLQDERVDPAACNNDAIRWASYYDEIKVVKVLLQDGRIDATDEAINYANEEIKEMLIAYKYRVDGKEYQKLKKEINF